MATKKSQGKRAPASHATKAGRTSRKGAAIKGNKGAGRRGSSPASKTPPAKKPHTAKKAGTAPTKTPRQVLAKKKTSGQPKRPPGSPPQPNGHQARKLHQLRPENIAQILKSESVSLLIGSGPSIESGLLSWDKLVDAMIAELRSTTEQSLLAEFDNFVKGRDALDIADYFKETVELAQYAMFLRKHFRTQASPGPMYRALAKLPVKTVITTNFDKLTEIAFRQKQPCDPPVVFNHRQLNAIGSDEQVVIKMHGDIDHPESIVLTRKDYRDYDTKYSAYKDFLSGKMAFSRLLVAGFGLRDINFDRIYSEARSLMDKTNRRAIVLMAHANPFDLQQWDKTDDVDVVCFDSHQDITRFIEATARKAT